MEYSKQQAIDETRRYFSKVYAWMFFGLLISGITAFWVAGDPSLVRAIVLDRNVFTALLIGEFILVLTLAFLVERISAKLAVVMFSFYCFTSGLTLSVIFLVFTIESIVLVFFIASGMFGVMSIYGHLTKKDLTHIGQVLIMGLFGVVIATIVNIFMANDMFSYLVSFVGVVVFAGLTAYDTQKIRNLNIIGNEGTPEDLKESIMGALRLYLDFVNMFLRLLKLFGKRRR